MLRGLLYSLIFCLMALGLSSCSTTKPRIAKFKEVSFNEVEGWHDDSHSAALEAFKHSCGKIMKLDVEGRISRSTEIGGSAIDWQVPCMEALALESASDNQAKIFFETWFKPYQIFDNDMSHEGMLTGYFHIELEGSKKKHGKYKYPVYKKPSNLESVKGSSSIDHAAINDGALSGKGLELVYVDNRARLYSMQIQGSGIVKLKEGGHMNLGFGGHNGYRFQGINQALRERGMKFESADRMMQWLHENPSEARQIIESDPSYVFFTPLEGEHAVGGHGTPLMRERSMAVDYGLYPYGTPVWVSTKLPERSIFNGREYKRLFIAQDTGGAIRGAIRGDVFFGRGKSAEKVASHFKARTKFYTFFPKTVKVPESYTATNG